MRKAQKKIAEQNLQKAVKVAREMAELAASDGKAFCVSHVDVGLDIAAVREAVCKVIEKVISSISPLSSLCLIMWFGFCSLLLSSIIHKSITMNLVNLYVNLRKLL